MRRRLVAGLVALGLSGGGAWWSGTGSAAGLLLESESDVWAAVDRAELGSAEGAELVALMADPVDLNGGDLGRLVVIPGVTAFLVERIAGWIRERGRVADVEVLAAIPGVDLELLRPFVRVRGDAARLEEEGHGEALREAGGGAEAVALRLAWRGRRGLDGGAGSAEAARGSDRWQWSAAGGEVARWDWQGRMRSDQSEAASLEEMGLALSWRERGSEAGWARLAAGGLRPRVGLGLALGVRRGLAARLREPVPGRGSWWRGRNAVYNGVSGELGGAALRLGGLWAENRFALLRERSGAVWAQWGRGGAGGGGVHPHGGVVVVMERLEADGGVGCGAGRAAGAVGGGALRRRRIGGYCGVPLAWGRGGVVRAEGVWCGGGWRAAGGEIRGRWRGLSGGESAVAVWGFGRGFRSLHGGGSGGGGGGAESGIGAALDSLPGSELAVGDRLAGRAGVLLESRQNLGGGCWVAGEYRSEADHLAGVTRVRGAFVCGWRGRGAALELRRGWEEGGRRWLRLMARGEPLAGWVVRVRGRRGVAEGEGWWARSGALDGWIEVEPERRWERRWPRLRCRWHAGDLASGGDAWWEGRVEEWLRLASWARFDAGARVRWPRGGDGGARAVVEATFGLRLRQW